jgi:hypothetical protein
MNWGALDEELARRRDSGRVPQFWWRDDDAAAPTPPLRRLLALSTQSAVPVALAVVPLAAVPELFAGHEARVLMHGTDHRNRAAPGEKKTEFAAAEPDEEVIARLGAARERLARLAGGRFLPVFVPPWNRFKRTLATRLPAAGLHGLSAYGPRAETQATRGVAQINTHVDIIDWHGTRGFIGEEAALRAVLGHLAMESGEPTGVLTHHALHDAAAWAFLERLFERTRRGGARWADAAALFPAAA